MGLMLAKLGGTFLTMMGVVAMVSGSLPAMPWNGQQADWPHLGIIPDTQALTPSHMI